MSQTGHRLVRPVDLGGGFEPAALVAVRMRCSTPPSRRRWPYPDQHSFMAWSRAFRVVSRGIVLRGSTLVPPTFPQVGVDTGWPGRVLVFIPVHVNW